MTTDDDTRTLRIEETLDGSPTLFVPDLEEHYHSVKGARTESEHVFVTEGLRARFSKNPDRPAVLLEVGFGTGLNALLSLLETHRDRHPLLYHTFDVNPLSIKLMERMWRDSLGTEEWQWMRAIHEAAWDVPVRLSDFFTLHKHHADLLSAPLPEADIIYMDAFAPEKTPELWSETFLRKLFDAAAPGARLSTYCAKGEVRRRLQAVGFRTHRTPGPEGGKREILTADKATTDHPIDRHLTF